MDKYEHTHRSHLFTLRIRAEDLGDGQTEWRGRVEHIGSGETRYCRDWPALVDYLLALLPQASGEARS